MQRGRSIGKLIPMLIEADDLEDIKFVVESKWS